MKTHGMTETLTLYHGTRVSEDRIREEGLTRPDYDKLIDEVLAKYGYSRNQVPEWIWRQELLYRFTEYKNFTPEFKPYIAFTLNYDQAKTYAHMGGEFEYLLIYYLMRWRKRSAQEADDEATKGRGKERVVTVRVSKEYIPKEILQQIDRIEEAGYEPGQFTWNIPVFQDIPPEWIVRIESMSHGNPHPVHNPAALFKAVGNPHHDDAYLKARERFQKIEFIADGVISLSGKFDKLLDSQDGEEIREAMREVEYDMLKMLEYMRETGRAGPEAIIDKYLVAIRSDLSALPDKILMAKDEDERMDAISDTIDGMLIRLCMAYSDL